MPQSRSAGDGAPAGWNPWLRFAVGRAFGLFGVVSALLVTTFLIVRLIPGDPALSIAGPEATAEQLAAIRATLGLDQPLLTQFAEYIRGIMSFDFGKSFTTQEPVSRIIAQRLPNTARLAGFAVLLVLLAAVPVGILMGHLTQNRRAPRLEFWFSALSGLGGALPEYLAGTLLALVFAVWLRWLPVAGATKWNSVILPAVAIGLRPIALLASYIRVETLNVLAQDYMRTARAKRLPARLFYLRHVLPNVLTVAFTIGGLLIAGLLGGTVITENVFNWPGLGQTVVQAVLLRDYPVIQAVVLTLGIVVVLINTAVDTVLGLINPRSLIRQP